MLRIEELNTRYNSILALKGISINVPKGEIFSIIGANGAGKSTLLKSISGLIKTKMGRILFNNQDIINLPANRIVSLGISQVPEGRQLFVRLSVKDNIHLGAYLYHKRRHRKDINEKSNYSAKNPKSSKKRLDKVFL